MCIIGTLLSYQIHISAGVLGSKEQWRPDKSVALRSESHRDNRDTGRSIKPIISNLLMGSKQFPHILHTACTTSSHLQAGRKMASSALATCMTSPSLSTPAWLFQYLRIWTTILKKSVSGNCLINRQNLCQPGFYYSPACFKTHSYILGRLK